MLLPLLADVRLATPSSSFRTDPLHPVVYSCLAYRLGASGCGRLMVLGGASITAAQACDLGIVQALVDTPEHTEQYLCALWASEGLVWHRPASMSFAEAVVLDAEKHKSIPNAIPGISWKVGGLALIRLTSVVDLENAIDLVENRYQDLNGVFIDCTGQAESPLAAGSTFMTRVRFFAAVVRITRRLERLSVPVCTMLSGKVSALAAALACASSHRVGNTSTLFDFTDALLSSVILDLVDALPGIIGIAESETLRLQRPVVNAADSLRIGLLTRVVQDDLQMSDVVCAGSSDCRSLAVFVNFELSPQEQAERCLAVSRQMEINEGVTAGELSSEVGVSEVGGVIHLCIRSLVLTLGDAETILSALQADTLICVFHLEPGDQNSAYFDSDSESSGAVRVVERMLCYRMPVIVVCSTEKISSSRHLLQVMSAADIVIASSNLNDELVSRIRVEMSRADIRWAHHWLNGFELIDIVVAAADVESELAKLIARFGQINPDIIRSCKANIPSSTVEESRVTMATLSRSKHDTQVDFNLVRLAVSLDGVATVELSDPSRFNAITSSLVVALRARLFEVEDLAGRGKVKVLVLQGAGLHFCTGGLVSQGKKVDFFLNSDDVDELQIIAEMSGIASLLRSMPIPTLAVVHGKVMGGGLALSLAVDWRVCANDTRFIVGNFPLGVSPAFMLSRALPLTVGWGFAMKMYMEDNGMTADEAVATGLMNATAQTQ